MSLNQTPSGERMHITIFGRRNSGKSSLINALTGQKVAIVSEVPGTTTDPVSKAMEILPIGPVIITDTAGIDDVGTLGELRVEKTLRVLEKTDLAILIVEAGQSPGEWEDKLADMVGERGIPMIVAETKIDLRTSHQPSAISHQPSAASHQPSAISHQQESENDRGTEGTEDRISSIEHPTSNIEPSAISHQPSAIGHPDRQSKIQNPKSTIGLWAEKRHLPFVAVSAVTGENIEGLKQALIAHAPEGFCEPTIIGDLISPGDIVVLVVPIDKAAPKGRLILPQVMTLRDVLDHDAYSVVVKERELKSALESLSRKPKIVITDSQAFLKVAADTPKDVWMTSFSILMARYKGNLGEFVEGARALRRLKVGDRVLISEGCTHHRQGDDIGTVQIPRWLRQTVGGELEFGFSSGIEFPPDLATYNVIIHCGGCTLNRREMCFRQQQAREAGIPMTNYGITLAYVHGMLGRALEPFPLARALWEESSDTPPKPKMRIARTSG